MKFDIDLFKSSLGSIEYMNDEDIKMLGSYSGLEFYDYLAIYYMRCIQNDITEDERIAYKERFSNLIESGEFELSDADIDLISKDVTYFKDILNDVHVFREMVAGDSGGDIENIAKGTNTGDVVNANPETLNKKKRKQ